MTEAIGGSGRSVLITGAAKRIGRAIALKMGQAGFDVAIHHRASDAEARQLADELHQMGRRSVIVQADLANEDEVRALVPAAVRALGPLTALVNNASVFEDDRVGALSRDSWDRHLDTNLRAPVVLAEAFAAQADRKDAAIVNLIDQRVLKPDPRFFSYSLSRNGLWWATRTLAQALAPNIRVNAVGPGPTLASIHQTPDEFRAEAAATLLQTPISPEDLAEAVLWLIDANKVTGQMIAVDGGQHLAWRTPDILE